MQSLNQWTTREFSSLLLIHNLQLMLKLKLQYFGHLMRRVDLLEMTLMLGGIGGQEEKGTTEDVMAGWHYRLNGHEFE